MEIKKGQKYKILFVCLGNICRSPAAQGVMEQIIEEQHLGDLIEVDSAGILGYHSGELPDKRMRVHARMRGLELTHHSRQVKHEDFEKFDKIIGMDDANLDDLKDVAFTLEETNKIVGISKYFRLHKGHDCIPDPYYGGSEGFENVLDLLDDACRTIADEIKENKQL